MQCLVERTLEVRLAAYVDQTLVAPVRYHLDQLQKFEERSAACLDPSTVSQWRAQGEQLA
jgi:hypothetical protein